MSVSVCLDEMTDALFAEHSIKVYGCVLMKRRTSILFGKHLTKVYEGAVLLTTDTHRLFDHR
jgi:hypothetical protein